MSTTRTGKERNLRSRQTVMGDYFSKSNKTKKPTKSESEVLKTGTKNKQEDKKLKAGHSPDPEKKKAANDKKTSKVAEKKIKESSKVAEKKIKESSKVAEKKIETPDKQKTSKTGATKQGQAVEKKTGLKRKVTGAGMFSFSWTRGAQKDTEDYRNGYPGKADHADLNDNYKFYMNQIPSKPDGDFIDKIHIDWWGDYRQLEVHHGYIQWLFPIRESGLNWHAQELQLHEIKKLQRSKKAMKRILTSYKMMLEFYGMELDNEEDGTIKRAENWRDRFRHLNRSYHNYLRITRILKCLGEFGYEHLKKNFVKFVLYEGLEEGTLSNVIDSCVKYWIGVLKEEEERDEMFDYYDKLSKDEALQSKRRNRSPSPPSYSSYWSNKDSDSKTGKKVISKDSKEDKSSTSDNIDDIDEDDTENRLKNELSDDDDNGALYHAMRLIDAESKENAGINNSERKSRKDHEMSDSGEESHQEESQEIAYWDKNSKKTNEEDIEGGSEYCDSLGDNDNISNGDTKKAVGSVEGDIKTTDEQITKNEKSIEEHPTNSIGETEIETEKQENETNGKDETDKENTAESTGDAAKNENVDNQISVENVSLESKEQKGEVEKVTTPEHNHEEMEIGKPISDATSCSADTKQNKHEEDNIETEIEAIKNPVEVQETDEEKMETQ